MRLRRLDDGHSLAQKARLKMIGLVSRREPPDVVKTLAYRPEYFGDYVNPLTQEVMRGPSDWAVGERELFAAFVSRENQCVF